MAALVKAVTRVRSSGRPVVIFTKVGEEGPQAAIGSGKGGGGGVRSQRTAWHLRNDSLNYVWA